MSVFGLGDLAFLGAAAGVASYDPDAQAYITAVEAADGQALETAVRDAINAFVVGCKADGIWSAIKASCILAGARTLAGALVPLVGPAPTNVGGLFVAGDYDRKTGLKGDGATKYLNSGRAVNADPQNSRHLGVFITSASTSGAFRTPIGGPPGNTAIYYRSSNGRLEAQLSSTNASVVENAIAATGFTGASRFSSDSLSIRTISINSVFSNASTTPGSSNVGVFAHITAQSYFNGRLAFYSIGESLDLALLDARVTALINAFAAAIP